MGNCLSIACYQIAMFFYETETKTQQSSRDENEMKIAVITIVFARLACILSEIIALAAQKVLEAEGIGTGVVSIPCWEQFDNQDEAFDFLILS